MSRGRAGPAEPTSAPVRHLLADRWRPVVLPGLGLALVGIAVAWAVLPAARSPLEPCLDDAKSCAGQVHTLHLVRVAEQVAPSITRVRTAGGLEFEIVGTDPALMPGTIVSVNGAFDAEGRLQLDGVRTHPWRRHKAALGLLGALATPLILLVAFTPRRRPEGWRLVPRFARGES